MDCDTDQEVIDLTDDNDGSDSCLNKDISIQQESKSSNNDINLNKLDNFEQQAQLEDEEEEEEDLDDWDDDDADWDDLDTNAAFDPGYPFSNIHINNNNNNNNSNNANNGITKPDNSNGISNDLIDSNSISIDSNNDNCGVYSIIDSDRINHNSSNGNSNSNSNSNGSGSCNNSNGNSMKCNVIKKPIENIPSGTSRSIRNSIKEINMLGLFCGISELKSRARIGALLGIKIAELLSKQLVSREQLEVWGIDYKKYSFIVLKFEFGPWYLNEIKPPNVSVGLSDKLEWDNNISLKSFRLAWTIGERCKNSLFMSNNNWKPDINRKTFMSNIEDNTSTANKIDKICGLMESTHHNYSICLQALLKSKFDSDSALNLILDNVSKLEKTVDENTRSEKFYQAIKQFDYCLYKVCGATVDVEMETSSSEEEEEEKTNNGNKNNKNDRHEESDENNGTKFKNKNNASKNKTKIKNNDNNGNVGGVNMNGQMNPFGMRIGMGMGGGNLNVSRNTGMIGNGNGNGVGPGFDRISNMYASVSQESKIQQLCEIFGIDKKMSTYVLKRYGYDKSVGLLTDDNHSAALRKWVQTLPDLPATNANQTQNQNQTQNIQNQNQQNQNMQNIQNQNKNNKYGNISNQNTNISSWNNSNNNQSKTTTITTTNAKERAEIISDSDDSDDNIEENSNDNSNNNNNNNSDIERAANIFKRECAISSITDRNLFNTICYMCQHNWLLRVLFYSLKILLTANKYCMICNKKLDFAGLKPSICDKRFCQFRHDEMELGFSLANEILERPNVTDLLISLCYSSCYSGKYHDFFPYGVRPDHNHKYNPSNNKNNKNNNKDNSSNSNSNSNDESENWETYFEPYWRDKRLANDTGNNNDNSGMSSILGAEGQLDCNLNERDSFLNVNGTPDAKLVLDVLDGCPGLDKLQEWSEKGTKFLKAMCYEQDALLYPLLCWIVCSNRSYLKLLDKKDRIPEIDTLYQFALCNSTPAKEAQFQAIQKANGSFYAWHGSDFGNWHSILRSGLKNYSGTDKMQNGAVHGNGIYLASGFSLSLKYSSGGNYPGSGGMIGYGGNRRTNVTNGNTPFWPNSQFGKGMYCLALCEVCYHKTDAKLRKLNEEQKLQQQTEESEQVQILGQMPPIVHKRPQSQRKVKSKAKRKSLHSQSQSQSQNSNASVSSSNAKANTNANANTNASAISSSPVQRVLQHAHRQHMLQQQQQQHQQQARQQQLRRLQQTVQSLQTLSNGGPANGNSNGYNAVRNNNGGHGHQSSSANISHGSTFLPQLHSHSISQQLQSQAPSSQQLVTSVSAAPAPAAPAPVPGQLQTQTVSQIASQIRSSQISMSRNMRRYNHHHRRRYQMDPYNRWLKTHGIYVVDEEEHVMTRFFLLFSDNSRVNSKKNSNNNNNSNSNSNSGISSINSIHNISQRQLHPNLDANKVTIPKVVKSFGT